MTTTDPTAYPGGEPDDADELFHEVEHIVDRVTDDEIEDRLRQLLAETGHSHPDDPGQPTRPWLLAGQVDAVCAELAAGSANEATADWGQAAAQLRAAQNDLAAARTAAVAAHHEAEIQIQRGARPTGGRRGSAARGPGADRRGRVRGRRDRPGAARGRRHPHRSP
jgi:hypothetical protein